MMYDVEGAKRNAAYHEDSLRRIQEELEEAFRADIQEAIEAVYKHYGRTFCHAQHVLDALDL